jgi:hypothetical protein
MPTWKLYQALHIESPHSVNTIMRPYPSPTQRLDCLLVSLNGSSQPLPVRGHHLKLSEAQQGRGGARVRDLRKLGSVTSRQLMQAT